MYRIVLMTSYWPLVQLQMRLTLGPGAGAATFLDRYSIATLVCRASMSSLLAGLRVANPEDHSILFPLRTMSMSDINSVKPG